MTRAHASSSATPLPLLRTWLRLQMAIDIGAGLLLLTLPLSVLARLPLPVLPEPASLLTLRLLGLYPMGLGIAFYAASVDGVNPRAAWVANAFRFAGGFALLSGATLDPAVPPILRTLFVGEWVFVAITAVLMRREGHRWWRPG